MRFRRFFLLPLAAAAVLSAQEPLNRPVPLLQASNSPEPGAAALSQNAARRAQELGLPALAAQLYRELLATAGGARRGDLALSLATALLDDNRPEEADQVLRTIRGPHGSAWHLRAGLAAAAERKYDAARGELAGVKAEELSAADRPWHAFLQGVAAGAAGDLQAAGSFYRRAQQAATTDLERARFFVAEQEASLRLGSVSVDVAEQTRQSAERFRGTAAGHDFARSYAVMLDGLGRKADAVAVLQRELLTLHPAERSRTDDCRFLIGMIGGASDGVGRTALMQLLDSGADAERQRAALQLLARASQRGAERVSFRAELDRLLAEAPPHPIRADLLLFRANFSLGDKDYAQAEEDARELLDKFPGSPLKPYAWGVLTGSAWEQRRYRTAAAYAASEEAETRPGEERAELGVLKAEASFRAGILAGDAIDFRNAADAYAAALRDRPAHLPPGELMFQRVEAEMEAGSLETAQKVLDTFSSDPAFDPVERWRAEWNLARLLQVSGQTGAAYGRVNRLLSAAGKSATLPAALRARMAWLQAELSFDAHEYGRTLALVAALRARLDGVPTDLRNEIASTDAVLEAEADFALNREAAGLAALERLRIDFPQSNAAVHSYIVEAEHDAQQERISTAQGLLIKLAEKYPSSLYAPYALYQAALQAERLGKRNDLFAANQLIESMLSLVKKYPATDPNGDLVFYARLKQGDLMGKLNQFPRAQEAYELLRNDFPRHKDIVYALLALAECHDAQSANDPSHAESARALLEDLNDRVDAPVDVRVEAGFNLGFLLARRGDAEKAQAVWWRDVVTAFLLEPARAKELGANGRYWMARTLLELGSLDVKQGRLEEAKQAWGLVLSAKLPGSRPALENLASLDVPAPRP